MAQSLYEMVAELLHSNPKKYLTAREIAEWIIENKQDYCNRKMSRTTVKSEKALIRQIIAEIGRYDSAIFEKLHVYKTADRPQKYYFDDKTTDIETLECKVHKTSRKKKNYIPN